MSPIPASVAVLLLASLAGAAQARQSDRNQIMDINADGQSCGLSAASSCTFSGNVVITQGTMNVQAARAVVERAGGEPSRALLSGGVTLRQQLDDGTPISVRAESVDYNLLTEVVVFTGNVQLTQTRGNLSGGRVVYDMKTGTVSSGGKEGGGRVHMRILPKNAQGGG